MQVPEPTGHETTMLHPVERHGPGSIDACHPRGEGVRHDIRGRVRRWAVGHGEATGPWTR